MRNALIMLLEKYKSIADSGDCGWWKAEEQDDYIEAQKELKKNDNHVKMMLDEQRKIMHDRLEELVNFEDENEKANFIIDVMKDLPYPTIKETIKI